MHIYQLEFTDGRSCTHIIPRPDCSQEEEIASTRAIFCGRLASMVRIIAPPPEKLPWKRSGEGWVIGGFKLIRSVSGVFHCSWLGGEVTGGKDEISAAVRLNWEKGC